MNLGQDVTLVADGGDDLVKPVKGADILFVHRLVQMMQRNLHALRSVGLQPLLACHQTLVRVP